MRILGYTLQSIMPLGEKAKTLSDVVQDTRILFRNFAVRQKSILKKKVAGIKVVMCLLHTCMVMRL